MCEKVVVINLSRSIYTGIVEVNRPISADRWTRNTQLRGSLSRGTTFTSMDAIRNEIPSNHDPAPSSRARRAPQRGRGKTPHSNDATPRPSNGSSILRPIPLLGTNHIPACLPHWPALWPIREHTSGPRIRPAAQPARRRVGAGCPYSEAQPARQRVCAGCPQSEWLVPDV